MTKKSVRYRLGLDIGIASVGWAVLRHNKDGNPDKIINRGVRVFEACEKPKDGKSLAAERREFRGLRRRLRRKKHRLFRIKELICSEFNISSECLNNLFKPKTFRKDIYVIRFESLDKKIEKEEWARLLVHFAQKRGFKSNRKSEKITNERKNEKTTEKADKLKDETGKLKAAIKTNEQLMESKGCRTIGELLYKNYKRTKQKEDGSFIDYFETRNKAGKYDLTFSREQVDDEVEYVFNSQKRLGNKFASDDIKEKYKEILLSQRNFDEGPGQGSRWRGKGNMIEKMVGTCTFEKGEPRAPKNSYTFERFMLIQKVNNVRLLGSPQKELTVEEKAKIINEAYSKSKLTFKQIRKLLGIGDYTESGKPQYVFNASIYSKKAKGKDADGKTVWNYMTYEKCEESTTFIRLKGYHDIKEAVKIDTLTPQDLDEIAYCLTVYKNDDRLKEALSQRNFKEELIKDIIEKAPNFDKFGHLSIKAMNKILPHLEKGLTYDKACLAAGYDFRNQNNDEKLTKLCFNDIANEIYTPVAKRAVSQTVKVINAIIREYGPPDCIHIELAREMAKNFEERKKLQEKNEDNQARNEKMMNEIREYESAPIKPGGQDLEKYKLWIEQKNYCAYSGENISIQDLFTNAAEVDHIIPYSKSFDNSYNNKVVVKTKYNQEKSNRLPMEYIKTKGDKEVKRFKDWVDDVIKNRTKKNNLLATEIDEKGLTERNLQDTQTATKIIADFIRNKLQFAESDKFENKVVCINGGVTSYIRRRLGLGKDRKTDNHHAEDAIIIASCSHKMQKEISDYEKIRRACNFKDEDVWIDRETGEVIKMTREFPRPWTNFREEVILWFEENPQSEINLKMRRELLPAYEEDEIIKPLFVSRMSNHKITGAAHKQTMLRTEEKDREEHIIKRVPLIELKLVKGKNNENEIEKYYNKECDKLLYDALLKRLIEFDGDAKEAFKEPFYKPKSNGQNGNIVSHVKIDSGKISNSVDLKKIGAKAANGDMVRIDVFYKLNEKTDKKQFYFVPVYVADFKEKELPNISTKGDEMKEEDGYKFEFSLYAKDLMRIKKKDEKPEMLYYTNAHIGTGAINAIPHNSKNKIEGIGIQNLEIFEKWEIDVLGNYCKAPYLPRNIKTLHGRRKKDYLLK